MLSEDVIISSCSFSPGLIPITLYFAFGAITLAKSITLNDGILGINNSPPIDTFKHSTTKLTASSSEISIYNLSGASVDRDPVCLVHHGDLA